MSTKTRHPVLPASSTRAPHRRGAAEYPYPHREPTVFDRRPELIDMPTLGAAWASAVRSNA